jgi:hypothetical protein
MEIRCTYKELVPLADLSIEMCKGLKVRFKKDLTEEARMLLTHGFLTPVFVWKTELANEVIDGVGRILAIKQINAYLLGLDAEGKMAEGAGDKISDVPVIFIVAENFDEARQKAILVNSMFGKINREELVKYAEEIAFTPEYITAHESYFVSSHEAQTAEVDVDYAGAIDKAESTAEPAGLPQAAGEDIFQPSSYTPTVDIDAVDAGAIDKAEKKIKETDKDKRKPVREITCKHCGHVFHIGE